MLTPPINPTICTEWTTADAGLLEIYDSSVSGVNRSPNATPSKTLIPKHNSMAYFEVCPNKSFHSVQEVFADRPRMSIQGWYHCSSVPEGVSGATLNRLKEVGGRGEDTEGDYSRWKKGVGGPGGVSESGGLTATDLEFLKKYINETYLTESSIAQIRSRFEKESSIQLRSFLLPSWSSKIKELITSHDLEDGLGRGKSSAEKYNAGEQRKGWKVIGPAHKQRMLEFNDGDDELGEIYNV